MTLKKCLQHSFIIVFILISFTLTACSSPVEVQHKTDSINILCTSFPQYDWAKNIIGDTPNIDVSLLIKNGVDTHSYQPSAEDIIKITNSDMVVLTGGQSDKEIRDVIKTSGKESLVVFDMMSELSDNLIFIDHSHQGEHIHNELSDISIYDEHIYLSIKNAKKLCRVLADKIIALDQEGADMYNANVTDYISQLDSLDKKYTNIISNSKTKTLVFADRYPFSYLARDYGLECFAAFPGCSAETDASFNVILSLASKIDELSLNSLITIDGGLSSIDESVISNTASKNIQTLSLESLQSVTDEEINAGLTYLSAMTDNLNIIDTALN